MIDPIKLYWTKNNFRKGSYFSHLGKYVYRITKDEDESWTAKRHDAKYNGPIIDVNSEVIFHRTMKDAKAACDEHANLIHIQECGALGIK